MTNKIIKIYTDGAALPTNPGRGGWSFIILENGQEIDRDSGGFRFTTNNRMEILAVLNSLYALNEGYKDHKIRIFCDSTYVVNGCNTWAENWVKTGARKSNMDLWNQIVELKKEYDIELKWVRGHNGNHYNELCDEMANLAANTPYNIADIIYEKIKYNI